ncbi:MAG: hypothetical protein WCG25_01415 [bacterium]
MDENTENKVNEIEKKEVKPLFNYRKMFWWVLALAILSGFICVLFFNDSTKSQAEAEKYKQMFESKESLSAHLKDSLNEANDKIKFLSSYQPLTSAMIDRDKVRSNMKYKPGDFARMKIDSSKVLIIDVIAGGDRFNYTLKYKIQKNATSYEEISPQLLY